MKKYGKYIGITVGVVALVFVLLQYQNCGSSSNSSGSTVVGPSGLSYSINLSPSSTNIVHGQNMQFTLNIQDSGTEYVNIYMGYLQNGAKNPYCQYRNQTTPIPALTCDPIINQTGTIQLYVEVDDANLGQQEVLCESANSPGCNGTFTITAQ